jgi:NAD-dependent deacetylase
MKIVVLTGAGISQESGLATFRGSGGLWEGHRVEEVASPQAFARNPDLVHRFYNARRRQLLDPSIQPNAAHRALAELEESWPAGQFHLVTQNVDDLHVRAGSRNVWAMHGELLKVRCVDSGEVFPWHEDLSTDTPHPRDPQRRGRLRPHIVWFGEFPLHLDAIERVVSQCDLFVAIGTSGVVYPAAGLVQCTPGSCLRIEINLDETPVGSAFHHVLRGPASAEVPRMVRYLLATGHPVS